MKDGLLFPQPADGAAETQLRREPRTAAEITLARANMLEVWKKDVLGGQE